ncbi:hypothetical protein [Nocardioides sp.]|uniref:hypothetical protein n=1 Tax=Nocardioides sp. TaxID=35761 RepID=UPI001A275253|nr:hypothetical protein [Nocardioides sp.]MBJ7359176.1 hypothetical protein [Nocardioides sp.]
MSTTTALEVTRLTTKQKVGVAVAALYGLTNIPSVLIPTPDGETGPPLGILVIDSALGVVALVAAVLAWRGSPVALRIAAGAIVVITLTGLPAFFVDVPMAVKAFVGVSVVVTLVAVVLMFSGRRPASVVD